MSQASLPSALPVCVRSIFGLVAVILFVVPPTTAVPGWEIDSTAFVTRVIDGDTFDTDPVGRVRLADIDAPEEGEPGAAGAVAHLASLVYRKRVYLDVDDLRGRDVYGRVVADVYVQYNATHLLNIQKALLEAGVVKVRDFPNEFDPDAWALHVHRPPDAPKLDDIPSGAWIAGGALIIAETYFFASLLRAWRAYRRSKRMSSDMRTRDISD